jgi:hypothetical protein
MGRRFGKRLGASNAWLGEVGNFAAGWIRDYRRGMEADGFAMVFVDIAGIFCDELPCTDHRGAAAKRQGGGSCGRIWRSGESDGVRAAWRGDDSFASDYVVRDYVHGLRDGAGSARRSCGGNGRVGDLQHDKARGNEAGDGSCYDASTCDAVAELDGTVFFATGYAADATATGSGASSTEPEEVAFLFDSVAGDTRRS